MRVWKLIIVIVAVLFVSVTCQADYKELISDWEKWTAPEYHDLNDDKKSPKVLIVENKSQKSLPSGHSIWRSKLTDLLDKGKFIQTGDFSSDRQPMGIQKSQAVLGSVLHLEDLEHIGLQRNRAILSATENYRAQLDGFDQVEALDAVLSRYSAFTKGVMTAVGPMKGGGDMSESYPFPGKASLKSRIVVENAAMASVSLNISIRDNITAIRKVYWDLILIHEKLIIFKETLALFEQLHDIASTMYKTGKTSYQDVIQITIKKQVLNKQLESLAEKRRVVEASLLALLDLPRDTPLGRPDTKRPEIKIPGIPSLVAWALKRCQELHRLDHGIVKMELMIEMAESMVLPSIDMGLSKNSLADINTAGTWSKKEAFPDQAPQSSMGAGLPKRPWFGTSGAWLSQTRKKLSALRHKRQSVEAQTMALIQSAWFNLDDAVRTYLLYKNSIVKLSSSALDVSTKEYESGSVSFAETADAYNNWLTARLSYSTAKRDAGVYRADLQKIVGYSF